MVKKYYGLDIYAIVSNTKCTLDLIQKDFCYFQCFNDNLKTLESLILSHELKNNVEKIIDGFKNHEINDILIRNGGKIMQEITDDDFFNSTKVLPSVFFNLKLIKMILAESSDCNYDLFNVVFNQKFKTDLAGVVKMMKTLSENLGKKFEYHLPDLIDDLIHLKNTCKNL